MEDRLDVAAVAVENAASSSELNFGACCLLNGGRAPRPRPVAAACRRGYFLPRSPGWKLKAGSVSSGTSICRSVS